MRRLIKLLLLLIPLIFIRCPCDNPNESEPYTSYDWQVSTSEAQGFNTDSIQDVIEEASNSTFIVSLLIVRNGYLIVEEYAEGFGKDDEYSIRSATKSFTSALVGIAIHAGLIDSVNQRMIDFFPQYNSPSLDPRKRQITIKHLLTMMAGFDTDENVDPQFSSSTNWIRDIIQLPLINDPGTTYSYSSMGTHLLSAIIAETSGMSTAEFADEYLCDPLEIAIILWDTDPQGYNFGGGSMYVTPRDMARFGYLYLNNGNIDGSQIVPAEWVQESIQDHVGREGEWGALKEMGYGYLWWLGKLNEYTVHAAIGYAGQIILVIPDLNMVIVTTCIFPFNDEMAENQSESIFELVANHIMPAITN